MTRPSVGDTASYVEDGIYAQPGEVASVFAAARRHWLLIAIVTAAGCLGTLLLCQALTPLYASKVAVMIDPREPKRSAIDSNTFQLPSEESVRKNEMAIIRSREVAERVVAHLDLEHDPEFNRALRETSALQGFLQQAMSAAAQVAAKLGLPVVLASADPASPAYIQDQVVAQFLDRLTTIPSEATRIIEIRFQSEDPERAAKIASVVVDQYTQYRRERALREAQAAEILLKDQIEAVNLRIRDAERANENLRQENGLVPATDLGILSEQLSDLTRQLVVVTGERAVLEARLARLETVRPGTRRVDTPGTALGSTLLDRLQADAAQAAARVSRLAVSYPNGHPRMQEARAELSALNAGIEAETSKLGTSVRSDLIVAKAKEATLRKMVEDTKAEMTKSKVSDIETRLSEREAEANRNLLAQLVARLNDSRTELRLQAANVRVLSPATIPIAPSYPPSMAVLAVGFVVSATGGTLLALLRERRDGAVRTAAQLRRMATVRVLGAVPAIARWNWLTRTSPAAGVLTRPTSMFAENLRAVWLQVDRSRTATTRTLLITSSLPNEGKSSITTSLARVLALGGRRIVVIDADLRAPTVHRILGLRRSPGLAELVAQTATMDDVLQQDRDSGAFVITAGMAVPSPSDLLQSSMMPSILLQLRTMFDGVIIDTPPVLAVPDAAILSAHTDMTALVVRWGATQASSVAAGLQRLRDFDAHVGIILTQVNGKKAAYYGYEDADMFSRAMRRYETS